MNIDNEGEKPEEIQLHIPDYLDPLHDRGSAVWLRSDLAEEPGQSLGISEPTSTSKFVGDDLGALLYRHGLSVPSLLKSSLTTYDLAGIEASMRMAREIAAPSRKKDPTMASTDSVSEQAFKLTLEPIKENIKEIKSKAEAIDKVTDKIKDDLTGFKSELSGMKSDLTTVKSDIASMKPQLDGVRTDVTAIKVKSDELSTRLTDIKSDFRWAVGLIGAIVVLASAVSTVAIKYSDSPKAVASPTANVVPAKPEPPALQTPNNKSAVP